MLDCLTALAHRLWVLVEPPLHGFEHVFMLPPRDAALLSRRATILDRTAAARVGRIAAQLLPMFLGSEGVLEFLAHRAAIDILLRQIDEVPPPPALGTRPPDRHQGRRRPGAAT